MNTKLCINAFAAGDFTLFHNNTLYKYYIGGYLESCLNKHLDCEFAMRQKWINNLTLYNIDYNCSYWHIDHIHQRENRNNYTRFHLPKQRLILIAIKFAIPRPDVRRAGWQSLYPV